MRFFMLISLVLINYSAFANIIINSTRIIYHENNKEVIVQLINNGNYPALVQSWIDDGDINSIPETANVPFLISPPVVKVFGNSGQQLQIKKISSSSLLVDRESVFYLNILDIPATPEYLKDKNTIQVAIKSRIKLFYRPKKLMGKEDEALERISVKAENYGLRITNNSPYYITIANIDNNGKKMLSDSIMIEPFSNVLAPTKATVTEGRQYNLLYIDDFGVYKNKIVTAE